jgi:hypothetical protein
MNLRWVIDVDAERTVGRGVDAGRVEDARSERVMAGGEASRIDRQVDPRGELARDRLHEGLLTGALVVIDGVLAEEVTVRLNSSLVETTPDIAKVQGEVVEARLRLRRVQEVAGRCDDLWRSSVF